MTDPLKGARSIEEIMKCASMKAKNKRFNRKEAPLFDFIPLTRVIPDRLHLFLRISDQLINQLIHYLKREDNITKQTKFTKYKRESYRHIKGFEIFLKSLGINWSFYVDRESKMLKGRSFVGPEKLLILRKIDMSNLLPFYGTEKARKLMDLWGNFENLLKDLDNLKEGDDQSIEKFSNEAKLWLDSFVKIYPANDVTPYMHILVCHIAEVIKLNGNLSNFTEQGLEKLNDNVSKWYFRSTSFNKETVLRQVIQKQNRLRKLQFDGGEKTRKVTQKCKRCKSKEHSAHQ